jgi:predicted pyridoxine 5'-phosphate oxidase superfamily flavin-nucleotide-binding protein/predicted small metal-binding protein
MQRRAGVLDRARKVGRTITSSLPEGVARFLARQRLAVAGSVDGAGRVWASLLAGPAGFLDVVDPQLVRLATRPFPGDPLADNIAGRPPIGLLVLDPRTRQRVRLNGRGMLSGEGLFLLVEQAYGNCPKYIQQRRDETDAAPQGAPTTPSVTSALDAAQAAAIARADTFFIASFHPQGGADASHRGGLPGFVRVLGANRLAFDDYPGNSMFNTLGNLVAYPSIGLLFVDFGNGDLLQLTGRPEVGPDFSVLVHVDEVRETRGASPLRFCLVAYSPSNPPLSREAPSGISSAEPEDGGQEEERDMAKEIACGDLVEGCAFTATAETEDDLLEQVVEHASTVHGVKEVTPELAARVKAAIRTR